MEKVSICLNDVDLGILKLLVKERIAILKVRHDNALSVAECEHCSFKLDLYESLLDSLCSKKV